MTWRKIEKACESAANGLGKQLTLIVVEKVYYITLEHNWIWYMNFSTFSLISSTGDQKPVVIELMVCMKI